MAAVDFGKIFCHGAIFLFLRDNPEVVPERMFAGRERGGARKKRCGLVWSMARLSGKRIRTVNTKAINYSGYFRGIGRGGGAGNRDLFSMDCWKSGSAAVPFDLEGRDAANRASGAFENALFDALAEGGGGEESLLGAGNHDLLLEAALSAVAQD